MDWFSDWFDTKYYHILYKNRDEQEAENFIQMLLQKHPLAKNACVLDLACGKGRHAKTLADLGYKTLGLDLSKQSIKFAKDTYKSQNLDFDVHDMRLPYYFEPKFDAVFNLFTSFGYFDDASDNKKVLQSIYLQLKKDGIFFFDYLNCKPILKNLPSKEEKLIDQIRFFLNKKLINGRIVKEIRFSDAGKDYFYQESIENLEFSQMRNLAKESGFELIQSYGDYQMAEYNEEQSKRMILLFKKK